MHRWAKDVFALVLLVWATGGICMACGDDAPPLPGDSGTGLDSSSLDTGAGTDAMTDSSVGADSGDDVGPADTSPPVEADCSNGLDDDGGGAIDCADSNCAGDPPCTEDCANGVDDDDDGLVDCADRNCEGDPACGELEMCADMTDNDGDGRQDCDDTECSCDPACGGPSCPSQTLSVGDDLFITTPPSCHAFSGSCSTIENEHARRGRNRDPLRGIGGLRRWPVHHARRRAVILCLGIEVEYG